MEPVYILARSFLRPSLRAWFNWTIEGDGNIPRRGPVILAFNHIAYLDPLAAAYVVDRTGRRPRFLAKAELFDDKRIAWILRGCNQIPVTRGTPSAPMALDHALAALQRGECVVVFPEGTITTDPELNPMAAKTGAARLALGSGAPLIPCAVWGTQNVWPKGYAKRWRPRQDILVRVGSPMNVEGEPDSAAAWQQIGTALMDEIARMVASLRPVVPDRRRPPRRSAA